MVKTETQIREIVEKFVQALGADIKVDKVILYGSYARGRANEWSDIDIAVISNDLKRLGYNRALKRVVNAHMASDASLEPQVYSLNEYNKASHLTFLGEIKRTGKIIYEAQG
ncbi:MAG: nucleotidyltransferase domain-containing protein [Chloroflexi bacterium]|nr:nucleotidyltransferase domain-containing protein [Chloroflexota bacterium]